MSACRLSRRDVPWKPYDNFDSPQADLGDVLCATGDAGAFKYFQQSLQKSRRERALPRALQALGGLAHLFAQTSESQQALELAAWCNAIQRLVRASDSGTGAGSKNWKRRCHPKSLWPHINELKSETRGMSSVRYWLSRLSSLDQYCLPVDLRGVGPRIDRLRSCDLIEILDVARCQAQSMGQAIDAICASSIWMGRPIRLR